MNENEFKNFQIKKKESNHQLKITIFKKITFFCAKFKHLICLFPCSRLEKCFNNFICFQFFSGAAHDAMYWPTVFLSLGGQETTPKKPSTQGQETTTFTSLSCSVITCTKYNLRKRSARHVALNITARGVYSNS